MLEVVCGPVFASKTTYLIDQGKVAIIKERPYHAFRIETDTRYDSPDVKFVSHNKKDLPATKITNSKSILNTIFQNKSLILIDEVQFFDMELPGVLETLVLQGHYIVAAGLDMDANGRPFGPMGPLLSIADKVIKLTSNCALCPTQGTATRSIYKGLSEVLKNARDFSGNIVQIGGAETFEPRCFPHWTEFMQTKI